MSATRTSTATTCGFAIVLSTVLFGCVESTEPSGGGTGKNDTACASTPEELGMTQIVCYQEKGGKQTLAGVASETAGDLLAQQGLTLEFKDRDSPTFWTLSIAPGPSSKIFSVELSSDLGSATHSLQPASACFRPSSFQPSVSQSLIITVDATDLPGKTIACYLER